MCSERNILKSKSNKMKNKTVPVTDFKFWIGLLILKLLDYFLVSVIQKSEQLDDISIMFMKRIKQIFRRIYVTFWSSLFFFGVYWFLFWLAKRFGLECLFFGLKLKCYGNCAS